MKNIFIVIPTLDPEEDIMSKFITELKKDFEHIVVVNDGSNSTHDKFFNKLKKEGIVVLKHYINYGKGRGLKTAFNYILNEYPDCAGVVTCDSDGQHSVKDIKKIAKETLKYPDKLILGVRNFDKENVPPKSKIGNKITRNVMKSFIGLDITDTQTGLRGLNRKILVDYLEVLGERYEYETNMLIACQEKGIPIKEVEIETIYINSNEGSHFNPIKDSIKIYKLFTKYIGLSLSTYLIDIILFLWFLGVLRLNSSILAATILSRVISSIYSYFIYSNTKFRNIKGSELAKYDLLVIVQMFMSGCFVTFFYSLLDINIIVIKVIVDLVIWVINMILEREFVFDGGKYE